MNNRDYKKENIENRKNENKKIRIWLISIVSLLGLASAILLYINNIDNKEPETVVENETTKINEDKLKKYNYSFVEKEDVYLPKSFENSKVEKKAGNMFIDASNYNKFAVVSNIELTPEEEKIYISNNINYYAKVMEDIIYDAAKIKNKADYVILDEFYNNYHTFYALVFYEQNSYKYIVLNVNSNAEGKLILTYSIIQLDKNDKELYSNEDIPVEQHLEILQEIFKDYKM